MYMNKVKALWKIISHEDFGQLTLDIYAFPDWKIWRDFKPYNIRSDKYTNVIEDALIAELQKLSDDIFYVREAALAVVHSDDNPQSISVGAYGGSYKFEKRTFYFSDKIENISENSTISPETVRVLHPDDYTPSDTEANIQYFPDLFLSNFAVYYNFKGKSLAFDIYGYDNGRFPHEIEGKYGTSGVGDFMYAAIDELKKFSPMVFRSGQQAFAVPYSEDHPDQINVRFKEKDHIHYKRQLTMLMK